MATLTTIDGGAQTLTGTFNSIKSTQQGMAVVLTSCSLAGGGTLVGSLPFGAYVDPVTATTCNVPLSKVQSLV
jgi:hypothetical protein